MDKLDFMVVFEGYWKSVSLFAQSSVFLYKVEEKEEKLCDSVATQHCLQAIISLRVSDCIHVKILYVLADEMSTWYFISLVVCDWKYLSCYWMQYTCAWRWVCFFFFSSNTHTHTYVCKWSLGVLHLLVLYARVCVCTQYSTRQYEMLILRKACRWTVRTDLYLQDQHFGLF